jgi:IS30 family transposase
LVDSAKFGPADLIRRRLNGNVERLLRNDHLPKRTDFDNVSAEQLAFVVTLPKDPPRRCLGYRTSHGVFQLALRGALEK